jgi:hypothetical protein
MVPNYWERQTELLLAKASNRTTPANRISSTTATEETVERLETLEGRRPVHKMRYSHRPGTQNNVVVDRRPGQGTRTEDSSRLAKSEVFLSPRRPGDPLPQPLRKTTNEKLKVCLKEDDR